MCGIPWLCFVSKMSDVYIEWLPLALRSRVKTEEPARFSAAVHAAIALWKHDAPREAISRRDAKMSKLLVAIKDMVKNGARNHFRLVDINALVGFCFDLATTSASPTLALEGASLLDYLLRSCGKILEGAIELPWRPLLQAYVNSQLGTQASISTSQGGLVRSLRLHSPAPPSSSP